MKPLHCLTLFLIPLNILIAQSPQKLSYQAVIRDNKGELLIDKNVGIRIQIKKGSEFGESVYVETHSKSTDDNGLITLEIGGGNVTRGTFSAINWGEGPYFLYTEIDPDGNTNYSIFALSQLLSVPYALHAKVADSIPGVAINELIAQMEELQELAGLKIRDYDGNIYKTVKIGNQIWMAENLKTTHYADGELIPNGTGIIDTIKVGDKYWFEPLYNEEYLVPDSKYYSWYAIVRGNNSSNIVPSGIQGVCPTGWHVPSSQEGRILIDTLGGELEAGGKLKATSLKYWNSPNVDATNESGFSALGTGYRDQTGNIELFKTEFTAATTSTYQLDGKDLCICLSMYSWIGIAVANQGFYISDTSHPVRCIKD